MASKRKCRSLGQVRSDEPHVKKTWKKAKSQGLAHQSGEPSHISHADKFDPPLGQVENGLQILKSRYDKEEARLVDNLSVGGGTSSKNSSQNEGEILYSVRPDSPLPNKKGLIDKVEKNEENVPIEVDIEYLCTDPKSKSKPLGDLHSRKNLDVSLVENTGPVELDAQNNAVSSEIHIEELSLREVSNDDDSITGTVIIEGGNKSDSGNSGRCKVNRNSGRPRKRITNTKKSTKFKVSEAIEPITVIRSKSPKTVSSVMASKFTTKTDLKNPKAQKCVKKDLKPRGKKSYKMPAVNKGYKSSKIIHKLGEKDVITQSKCTTDVDRMKKSEGKVLENAKGSSFLDASKDVEVADQSHSDCEVIDETSLVSLEKKRMSKETFDRACSASCGNVDSVCDDRTSMFDKTSELASMSCLDDENADMHCKNKCDDLYSVENLRHLLQGAKALKDNSLNPVPLMSLTLEVVFAAVNCGLFTDNHIYGWVQKSRQKKKNECTKVCHAQYRWLKALHEYITMLEERTVWKVILENTFYCLPKCDEMCLIFGPKDFFKNEVIQFYKSVCLKKDPLFVKELTTYGKVIKLEESCRLEVQCDVVDVSHQPCVKDNDIVEHCLKTSSDNQIKVEAGILDFSNDGMPSNQKELNNSVNLFKDVEMTKPSLSAVPKRELGDSLSDVVETKKNSSAEETTKNYSSCVTEDLLVSLEIICGFSSEGKVLTSNKLGTRIKVNHSRKEELKYSNQFNNVLFSLYQIIAFGKPVEDFQKMLQEFHNDLRIFESVALYHKTELQKTKIEIKTKNVHNQELNKTIKETNRKLESRDRRVRALEEELKNLKASSKMRESQLEEQVTLLKSRLEGQNTQDRNPKDASINEEGKFSYSHPVMYHKSSVKTRRNSVENFDVSRRHPEAHNEMDSPTSFVYANSPMSSDILSRPPSPLRFSVRSQEKPWRFSSKSPVLVGYCGNSPQLPRIEMASPMPISNTEVSQLLMPLDAQMSAPMTQEVNVAHIASSVPQDMYMGSFIHPDTHKALTVLPGFDMSLRILKDAFRNSGVSSSPHMILSLSQGAHSDMHTEVRGSELTAIVIRLSHVLVQNRNTVKLQESVIEQMSIDLKAAQDKIQEQSRELREYCEKNQTLEDTLVHEEFRTCSLQRRLAELQEKEASNCSGNSTLQLDKTRVCLLTEEYTVNSNDDDDTCLSKEQSKLLKELEERLLLCSSIICDKNKTLLKMEGDILCQENMIENRNFTCRTLTEELQWKDVRICDLENKLSLKASNDKDVEVQDLNGKIVAFQEEIKEKNATLHQLQKEANYFTSSVIEVYQDLIELRDLPITSTVLPLGRCERVNCDSSGSELVGTSIDNDCNRKFNPGFTRSHDCCAEMIMLLKERKNEMPKLISVLRELDTRFRERIPSERMFGDLFDLEMLVTDVTLLIFSCLDTDEKLRRFLLHLPQVLSVDKSSVSGGRPNSLSNSVKKERCSLNQIQESNERMNIKSESKCDDNVLGSQDTKKCCIKVEGGELLHYKEIKVQNLPSDFSLKEDLCKDTHGGFLKNMKGRVYSVTTNRDLEGKLKEPLKDTDETGEKCSLGSHPCSKSPASNDITKAVYLPEVGQNLQHGSTPEMCSIKKEISENLVPFSCALLIKRLKENARCKEEVEQPGVIKGNIFGEDINEYVSSDTDVGDTKSTDEFLVSAQKPIVPSIRKETVKRPKSYGEPRKRLKSEAHPVEFNKIQVTKQSLCDMEIFVDKSNKEKEKGTSSGVLENIIKEGKLADTSLRKRTSYGGMNLPKKEKVILHKYSVSKKRKTVRECVLGGKDLAKMKVTSGKEKESLLSSAQRFEGKLALVVKEATEPGHTSKFESRTVEQLAQQELLNRMKRRVTKATECNSYMDDPATVNKEKRFKSLDSSFRPKGLDSRQETRVGRRGIESSVKDDGSKQNIEKHSAMDRNEKEELVNSIDTSLEVKEGHSDIEVADEDRVKEMITGPKGMITGPKGMISRPKGKLTGPKGMITEPKAMITGSKEMITGSKEMITGPKEIITEPKEIITGPKEMIIGPAGSIERKTTQEKKEALKRSLVRNVMLARMWRKNQGLENYIMEIKKKLKLVAAKEKKNEDLKEKVVELCKDREIENIRIVDELKAKEFAMFREKAFFETDLQAKEENIRDLERKLQLKLDVVKDQGNYIGELLKEKAEKEKRLKALGRELKCKSNEIFGKDEHLAKLVTEKAQDNERLEENVIELFKSKEVISEMKKCIFNICRELTAWEEAKVNIFSMNNVLISQAKSFEDLLKEKIELENFLKTLCEGIIHCKNIFGKDELLNKSVKEQDLQGKMEGKIIDQEDEKLVIKDIEEAAAGSSQDLRNQLKKVRVRAKSSDCQDSSIVIEERVIGDSLKGKEIDIMEVKPESLEAVDVGNVDFQKIIDSLNAEKEMLQNSLDSTSTEKWELEKIIDMMSVEKDALQKVTDDLTTEKERLQKAIDSLSSKNEVLEEALESLNTERQELLKCKNKVGIEKLELQNCMELLTVEKEQLQKSMESLKTEKENLNNKLKEKEVKLGLKEDTLLEMQQTLEMARGHLTEAMEHNKKLLEDSCHKDQLIKMHMSDLDRYKKTIMEKENFVIELQKNIQEFASVEKQNINLKKAIEKAVSQEQELKCFVESLGNVKEILVEKMRKMEMELTSERERHLVTQSSLDFERQKLKERTAEKQRLVDDIVQKEKSIDEDMKKWDDNRNRELQERMTEIKELLVDKRELRESLVMKESQFLEVQAEKEQLRLHMKELKKKFEWCLKQKDEKWKRELSVLDNQFFEVTKLNSSLIDQLNYLNDFRVTLRKELDLKSSLTLSNISTSQEIDCVRQICSERKDLESQVKTLKSSLWEEQLQNETLGKLLQEEVLKVEMTEKKLQEQEAESVAMTKSVEEKQRNHVAMSLQLQEELERSETTELYLKEEQLKVGEAEKNVQELQEILVSHVKSLQEVQLKLETAEAIIQEEPRKFEHLNYMLQNEQMKNENLSQILEQERSQYLRLLGEFNEREGKRSHEIQRNLVTREDKECQTHNTLDNAYRKEMTKLQYDWDLEKMSSHYFCKNLVKEYKESKDTLESLLGNLKTVIDNQGEKKNRLKDLLVEMGEVSPEALE